MITIPATIQTLFKTDGINKNFRVQFPNGENADLTNSDIVFESMHFTESACSREVFQFGLAERSEIQFECVGVQNIYGMTIVCSIEIDTSSLTAAQITAIQSDPGDGTLVLEANSDIGYGYYRVPLGTFIVDSCPRQHGAMKHRKVVAYSKSATEPSGYTQYKLNYAFLKDTSSVTINPFAFMVGETQSLNGMTYTTTTKSYTQSTNTSTASVAMNWQSYKYLRLRFTSVVTYSYDSADVNSVDRLTCTYDSTALDDLYAMMEANGYDLSANDSAQSIKWGVLSKLRPVGYIGAIQTPTNEAVDYGAYVFSDPTDTGYIYGGESSSYHITCPISVGGIEMIGIDNYGNETVIASLGSYTMVTNPVCTTYTLSSGYTGVSINLASTSKNNFNGSYYGYQGTYDVEGIVEGTLELMAMFGLYNRSGGVTGTLLPSSPVSIVPSEYSDLWWDEYSIDEIGVILFKLGDEEFTYEFGTGSSVYDMRDNYVLQNLSGATSDTVCTLLDALFIPNISGFGFVPVDLSMIGLPYLEAGDYLSIDNADGGTVLTYALTRTIDGIQHLSDTIASQSGEIMGEG